MSRILYWLAVNGVFAASLYLGLERGIEGAANVAQFMAWWSFAMAILAAFKSDKVVEAIREKPSSVPRWVDVTFDVAATLVLVWHAWWWTGLAYGIHCMVLIGLRALAREKDQADDSAADMEKIRDQYGRGDA